MSSSRHPRWRAFVTVSALALGAGVLLGALIATSIELVVLVSGRGLTWRDALGMLALGSAWGGAFGLVLGPLTAFGLLRAVPLGRAILATAAGSVAGLATTFVMGANPFVSIPAGFLVGALYARLRLARRVASLSSSGADAFPASGARDSVENVTKVHPGS